MPHPRRVIVKAEAVPQGTDQRFLVTNLEGTPFELYQFYMRRGQVENYIKEEFKNAVKVHNLQGRQRKPTVCRGHPCVYSLLTELQAELYS